ncbi:hypothetical protein FRC04_005904 [Tulasnella sp. 424]|nr:hypothetical protein FRC04_005904 [Tulasnella sp. 424]
MTKLVAFVSWSSEFFDTLVRKSLLKSLPGIDITFYTSAEEVEALVANATEPGSDLNILQWSTYDPQKRDEPTHSNRLPSHLHVLSSSYTIRKALIRKHFLYQQTFVNYLTKHPESPLTWAVPKTWSIDIAFADELDELWADELYDLGELIDLGDEANDENPSSKRWWILKPGMADRGMGIRLFRTREELSQIFQSFEDDESSDEEEENDQEPSRNSEEEEGNTRVSTSQLRHFVIQEYLSAPLLLDPAEADIAGGAGSAKSGLGAGKKFHLRVYCVANGALKVFFSPHVLALFAAMPYRSPGERTQTGPSPQHQATADEDPQSEVKTISPEIDELDLAPHLTNTCLQHDGPDTEGSVRLLSELVGCTIYSNDPTWNGQKLTQINIDDVMNQVSVVLGETFTAALASPVHFQPLPNAFELFGVDLLVSHGESGELVVSILELNAEPAIEMTGPRLGWILDDLFGSIAKACVHPYFSSSLEAGGQDGWRVGETRYGLRKCLDVQARERGG